MPPPVSPKPKPKGKVPPIKSFKKEIPSRGSLRIINEKRQISGLLTLLGFAAVIQPLYEITSNINRDGYKQVDFYQESLQYWIFIGSCITVFIGGYSALLGYLQNVLDAGSQIFTIIGIVVVHFAFVPYITNMMMLGKMTKDAVPGTFIPLYLDPDVEDEKLVGSLGIVGILSYGFAMIGSLSFLLFSLLAFQNDAPEARDVLYYQGRQRFYTVNLYIAGCSQLAIAVFLYMEFDQLWQVEGEPVRAGFYVVNQPVMTAIVGFLQVICGCWGFARTCFQCSEDNGKMFQGVCAVTWIAVIALQCITNPGYSPGAQDAGTAPTVAAFSLALMVMPSYLDYKRSSLPAEFEPTYYGDDLPEDDPEVPPAVRRAAKKFQSIASKAGSKDSSQMSETIESLEKKQKILEKSLIQLAKKQREMERNIADQAQGPLVTMSASGLSLDASDSLGDSGLAGKFGVENSLTLQNSDRA